MSKNIIFELFLSPSTNRVKHLSISVPMYHDHSLHSCIHLLQDMYFPRNYSKLYFDVSQISSFNGNCRRTSCLSSLGILYFFDVTFREKILFIKRSYK